MRILVVEDDVQMVELLQRGLVDRGHRVDIALDGLKGLEKAQSLPFDALVLDIMLPGVDGLTVARRLRSRGIRVPILMLTARDSVNDIVRGLDSGADDYLTKPFSFEVLAARLRVLCRRSSEDSGALLHIGDLSLNSETHEVYRGEKPVTLTPTEFVLLKLLMRRVGRVVSRAQLIDAVWGTDRPVGNNTVDVFIFQLRNKIEAARARRMIHTVRGFGYILREGEDS